MSLYSTGERFIPGMAGEGATDHLHRYVLARKIALGLDVLDIASGEGYGSAMLAEVANRVTGVDIDSDTIAQAIEKYQIANLEFLQGDCANLKFSDSSFDLVVSFETIEHHDKHVEMLREIRRVLRPSGVLLISSPNRPEFNRDRTEPYPFHVKELDYNELNVLLCSEFSNVAFYGQRSMSGSLVVPLDMREADFFDFDHSLEGARALLRPVYFVALAGNAVLPNLGQSVFESDQVQEFFKSAPVVCDIRVYFACESNLGYDQDRSFGISYPVNGVRQNFELKLEADSEIQKIRLDLSSAPGAVYLNKLSIYNDNGSLLWDWHGAASAFYNVNGISIRDASDGLLFLCLNDDPQCELCLPDDILKNLGSTFYITVDITPCRLNDVLSDIILQDDREIAELRAKVVESSFPGLIDMPLETSASQVADFSRGLESLSNLVRLSLNKRDKTIYEQRIQIASFKDELLRAETQLDLLKDLFANRQGEGL